MHITRHNQQTYILFLSSFSLFNDNFNNVSIKHSAGADKITYEMLQKLAKRSAKPVKSNA